MSAGLSRDDVSLPLEALQRIEKACDSFRKDLEARRDGSRKTEHVYDTTLEDERVELLRALEDVEKEFSSVWYYVDKNDRPTGAPVSKSQLKEVAQQGKLPPADKLWRDGRLVAACSILEGVYKVGNHELADVLGHGGMGVVFKAKDNLGRHVALKMILADDRVHDNRRRVLFEHEARKVARLEHPNIVPVHAYGVQDGQQWFSLDLVAGGTLASQIGTYSLPTVDPKTGKDTGGQSWSKSRIWRRSLRIARLMEILARAVHYAHSQGIVHQDLKPANVLLSKKPEKNAESDSKSEDIVVPKITDFGLARLK